MRKQAINSSSLRIAVRKNYSLLLVVDFHFADFEMLTANRTDALLAFVYAFCIFLTIINHQVRVGITWGYLTL